MLHRRGHLAIQLRRGFPQRLFPERDLLGVRRSGNIEPHPARVGGAQRIAAGDDDGAPHPLQKLGRGAQRIALRFVAVHQQRPSAQHRFAL